MLTYHDIAVNYDLFVSILYEAYVVIMFYFVLKTFYEFSFTLNSEALYIHIEKIFALIPLMSIYNSYSNIYSWQHLGLFYAIIDRYMNIYIGLFD